MPKASINPIGIHLDSAVDITGKTGGTLAVTDTTAATPAALGYHRAHIRVTNTMYIRVSPNPTADLTTSYRVEAADGIVPLALDPNDKIAAICESSESGTLYYHEVG